MIVLRKVMLVMILACIISLNSCSWDDDSNCIDGEGVITTEILSLSNFDGIDLKIDSNVTITQGVVQEVKAIGHPNIIDKLETSVLNNFWKIELEDGCYNDYDLAIEITVPNIELVKVSGSGDLVINDFYNQNSLESIVSGSGDITLNEFEGIINLDVALSGSGSIKANNDITTLDALDLSVSGSGKYLGFAIVSNSATVNASGSGDSELTTKNNLNVTISGSGDVSYKSTPIITQSITGSGDLINAN